MPRGDARGLVGGEQDHLRTPAVARGSGAQHDLGVDFGGDDPALVIKAYEGVVENVDLASIAAREDHPA